MVVALVFAVIDLVRRRISLIYDVLTGDRSLFTSSAGLAAAFRAFQPLLDNRPEPESYPDDFWGSVADDQLTDGLGWRLG
jgi:glucose-6-phosphate 1-dehydrogenase